MGPQARLECQTFDSTGHRPWTKAAEGLCSWTEHCRSIPTFSATVDYEETGRSLRYGLCDAHHFRVHQYFDVAQPAQQEELTHLLECWADGFATSCRSNPVHQNDGDRGNRLSIGSRGLETDEARSFLRTWRAGLVEIDVDGTFNLPATQACPPALHIIGRGGDAVALHTEYLIHLGVMAELVEDLGWAISDLAFEQGEWDALGFRSDRVTLAVEAKARASRSDSDSLESLRDSILLKSEDPEAVTPPNHERKWDALAQYAASGPVEVLLVASGARWWFDAGFEGGGLRVAPRG